MSESETNLYQPIITALAESRLACVWRNQAGSVRAKGGWIHMAPEGTPDLIGFVLYGPRKGAFVGLEVKAKRGRETTLQATWRTRIVSAGGIAAVVYSPQEAVTLLRRELTPELEGIGMIPGPAR